eukprot:tig00020685_g12946.t1
MQAANPAAEVLFANELAAEPSSWRGRQVRVAGRLAAVDFLGGTAVLEWRGARVDVDTSTLALAAAARLPEQYEENVEFIGEFVSDSRKESGYALRPYIARRLEDDMELREEALRVRRAFLARLQLPGGQQAPAAPAPAPAAPAAPASSSGAFPAAAVK